MVAIGVRQLAAAVVVLTAVGLFAGDDAVSRQSERTGPTAPQAADAEIIELPNGLKLYLIEDHRRPVVDIVARVSAGSLREPAELAGLADLHGRTLRSGGSSTITAEEIDEMLHGVDGWFSVNVRPTATILSAQVPRTQLDLGLSIVADVLMYPAFPFVEIESQRILLLETAEGAESDNRVVALQELMRKAYGEDSPHSRIMSPASLQDIRRRDLVAYHADFFRPNFTRLGIWGAFDRDDVFDLVKMAFEGWEPGPTGVRRLPDVVLRFDSTLTLIHQPGASESVVIAGHLLPAAGAADHPALRVAASLLTHRSAGRVNRLLRRDDVGASEVFGDFIIPLRYPGLLYVGAVVPPKQAAAAAYALQREMRRLIERPASEDEVVAMRTVVLRQLQREAASVAFRLEQFLAADEFGYPRDFYSRLISAVEHVGADDVAAAARKHFRPQALHTVIIGTQSALEEAISLFGSSRRTSALPD